MISKSIIRCAVSISWCPKTKRNNINVITCYRYKNIPTNEQSPENIKQKKSINHKYIVNLYIFNTKEEKKANIVVIKKM